MDNQSKRLRFFLSPSHSCNYLKNREASSLFVDPVFPKNKVLYSTLVANGFRRSGEHLYQPYCTKCSECIPIRIPVNDFKFRRSQKRTWKKNQDLKIEIVDAVFQKEHFELYTKYLAMRHPGGGMDNPTRDDYKNFLWSSWSETRLFEFRLNKRLIAVAVVDQLENAFSAVYTFFDPDSQHRSPGKYAILYLIEQSRLRGFTWLYLGYWIAECNKMKYKIEYQPVECFINEKWKKFSTLDFAVTQN
ncbi:MAG: arginyltransferase [Proteobacteria bacterium]|nr:arginyltransferase [Pseudomonadota bacterium]NOG59455.1 arginyltransferase [Pseudomonadota bacterium]